MTGFKKIYFFSCVLMCAYSLFAMNQPYVDADFPYTGQRMSAGDVRIKIGIKGDGRVRFNIRTLMDYFMPKVGRLDSGYVSTIYSETRYYVPLMLFLAQYKNTRNMLIAVINQELPGFVARVQEDSENKKALEYFLGLLDSLGLQKELAAASLPKDLDPVRIEWVDDAMNFKKKLDAYSAEHTLDRKKIYDEMVKAEFPLYTHASPDSSSARPSNDKPVFGSRTAHASGATSFFEAYAKIDPSVNPKKLDYSSWRAEKNIEEKNESFKKEQRRSKLFSHVLVPSVVAVALYAVYQKWYKQNAEQKEK